MAKIICGLGNIGPAYQNTRHNLGFVVVDNLTRLYRVKIDQRAEYFDFGCTRNDSAEEVYLIRPTTFVNRSGLAAREALDRFECRPDEFFVISDDFNLSLGTVRIRKKGSAGGHNGLESIIYELETEQFPRLRMGIGPLPEAAAEDEEAIVDFVLGRFTGEEIEGVAEMISRTVAAVELIVNDRFDLAISKYNSTNPTPEN